jgi:ankyrin repeat protein
MHKNLRKKWFEAVKAGDLLAIEAFLDDGVSINAKDAKGTTALGFAIEARNPDVLRTLVARAPKNVAQSGTGAVESAVIHNFMEGLAILYEAGYDVDEPGHIHTTPLLTAFKYGRLDCAKRLIGMGADIGKFDGLGRNAAIFACEMGSRECLELAILSGATLKMRNVFRKSALDYAKAYPDCLGLVEAALLAKNEKESLLEEFAAQEATSVKSSRMRM